MQGSTAALVGSPSGPRGLRSAGPLHLEATAQGCLQAISLLQAPFQASQVSYVAAGGPLRRVQADIADCLAAILRAGQLPAAAVTEQVLPFVLPRTLAALTSDGNAGGSSGSSAGTNSHKSSHSSGAEGRTGGSFPNSSSSSFTGSCHGGSSGGSSLHEAWLGCFQALAGAVDRQTLYMRVLPAVLAVGASPSGGVSRQQRQQQPSVAERCVRCRLLAALAGALSAEAVELQLVGPAVSLCQDVESEVRAAMCAALPALGAALAGIAAPSAGAAAAPAPAALGGVGSRRAGTERAGLGALLREALQLLEDEEVGMQCLHCSPVDGCNDSVITRCTAMPAATLLVPAAPLE